MFFDILFNGAEFEDCWEPEGFDWENGSKWLAMNFPDKFNKWWNPTKYNYRNNSYELAMFCSKYFRLWWDDKKFNWNSASYALATECNLFFDTWWDPNKFNWKRGRHGLMLGCRDKINIWLDPDKIDWYDDKDLDLLNECCSDFMSNDTLTRLTKHSNKDARMFAYHELHNREENRISDIISKHDQEELNCKTNGCFCNSKRHIPDEEYYVSDSYYNKFRSNPISREDPREIENEIKNAQEVKLDHAEELIGLCVYDASGEIVEYAGMKKYDELGIIMEAKKGYDFLGNDVILVKLDDGNKLVMKDKWKPFYISYADYKVPTKEFKSVDDNDVSYYAICEEVQEAVAKSESNTPKGWRRIELIERDQL